MTEPEAPAEPGWQIVTATALAYAVVGWLALTLAVPPGFASPLYPSAGVALAAALVCGRIALPGVLLGAFLVNVVLSASRGQIDAAALVLPAAIAVGATLQAAAGLALMRRHVPQPLVLATPREIALAGALGAAVACLVSPTVATLALRASGTIGNDQILVTWGTWWVGDTLGVLIGTPLVLTLIGRPRSAWASRRRTVGLPLLVATLLLGAATLVVSRWDEARVEGNFVHDADELADDVEVRLARPLYALQAVHAGWLAGGQLSQPALADAAAWWLAQPLGLQAMGYSVRVARPEVPAFEARTRADGLPQYRVFEREAASLAAGDADVLALRLIAPLAPNAGALGVNTLSVPAARSAVLAARDSGQPTATRGFRLTQAVAGETGFVVYQALYDRRAATPEARREAWHGVVFVTAAAEGLFTGMNRRHAGYLRWCLVDQDPAAAAERLAGPPGCERVADGRFSLRREIAFASRALSLHVHAEPAELPGRRQANAWLFSVAGMLAAAMLGALLLTVTGRARRIELAVAERTAELEREVHERTHAELALRDSEARLRSILDNVPIGVMFLDTAGRIVETNPRLCEMLGRPAFLLMRSSLAELSHPDDHASHEALIADLLAGRVEIGRRPMRLQRSDGRMLWVQVHLTLLREGEGPPQRLAGAVEDITEHLRLEESERALDRAEAANRAKSEFVSRMSHELRTPLNAMIGFTQLLALDREPALAPHQREWTQQVQRAGWHLLEMINDTLDLARIESGAVQLAVKPVDLPAMVHASLALVANAATQRGVATLTDLSPAAGAVLADETRLKQVLTNLLSNGIKYNREGGAVAVSTAVDAEGRVEIAVRDSGIGMTPEQMSALFQPYNRLGREQSTIEGTGIGLVISRRLAELMGGALEVASVSGEGSVFTLRLPRAELPAPAPAADKPPAAAPYHRRLLHYIEDNETNVEIMRGILARRPQVEMEVSTFGLDGMTAIRQRRPDLILLDMHLPDISGLELLRHLKQDDDVADIPVIVLSADATAARMQEALTLGAVQYLTKPVDIASFLEALDAMLQNLETRWG